MLEQIEQSTMKRVVPNNSIIHMTIFGVAIGAGVGILSMLGLMIITLFGVPNYPIVSLITTAFFSTYFGLTTGGVAGGVIGVINGFLVKFLLRSAEFPLSREKKQQYYRRVRVAVGVTTAILTLVVMIVAARVFLIYMLIPVALATAGMMFGVRFFLERWQAYTGLSKMEVYAEDPEQTVQSAWRQTTEFEALPGTRELEALASKRAILEEDQAAEGEDVTPEDEVSSSESTISEELLPDSKPE